MTLFDPEVPSGPPAGGDSGASGRRELPAATERVRLVLAYDGTGFRGFAAQPGQRTVAGVVGEAIATVVRHPVQLTCAGRTDAGVHARGQVVHVDVREGVDLERLAKSVNALCTPEVVVRSADPAPDGFDARRSARFRRYRYLVLEAAVPDPLLATTAWTVAGPLDLRAMAAAADAVVGEHDFRAFCRRPPGTAPSEPISRRVTDARWRVVTPSAGDCGSVAPTVGATTSWVGEPAPGDLGGTARLLRFDIEASSFCHQMVRSLVGTFVDVGRGRRRAGDIHWMLQSGDRRLGGDLAPPHGLCLLSVSY